MKLIKTKDEKYWQTEIREALEWRRKFTKEDRWPLFLDYYLHNVANPRLPHFNLVYMLGNVLVPSLVFQTPGILNTPTSANSGAWPQFFDSVDKYLVDVMEVTDVAERGIINGYLNNVVCIGFGFDITAEQDATKPGEDPEDTFPEVEGSNRARKLNLPWLDLIPPHRCLVAKGTKTMRNCRWAAKLIAVPTAKLKKSKLFKNVTSSSCPPEILPHESHLWAGGKDSGYTFYWEIHDAEDKQWLWLSTDGTFILDPTEDPLQVYGLPFEIVPFNSNPESIWGTPDVSYIESAHLEGEETRQYGRLQRRLALLKVLYDSDAISQEELQNFMSGPPGIGLPIKKGTSESIKSHIEFIQSHVQIEYFEAQKQFLNDAQLISGNGPNQMGTFAGGRRTRYETQVVENSNTIRTSRRRAKLAEAIERLMLRSNIMVSKYWNQSQVQQVVGVEGALYWVKATPTEIKSFQDILRTKVNVESMAPISRETKKAEAMQILQMLTQFTQSGVNPMPIIQQLLSTFEWMDVRQVMPQMATQYAIDDFVKQQQGLMDSGNLGPQIQKNLAGVPGLADRYPSGGGNGNDSGTMQENIENANKTGV